MAEAIDRKQKKTDDLIDALKSRLTIKVGGEKGCAAYFNDSSTNVVEAITVKLLLDDAVISEDTFDVDQARVAWALCARGECPGCGKQVDRKGGDPRLFHHVTCSWFADHWANRSPLAEIRMPQFLHAFESEPD